uniref:Uncharacterized protein n=1 Tax=Aegilops tauschii subsp. strangulata TaxID=200361 RepID=A0A453TBW5_AEGTS
MFDAYVRTITISQLNLSCTPGKVVPSECCHRTCCKFYTHFFATPNTIVEHLSQLESVTTYSQDAS